MALRLDLRQSQSIVMTPQLQQAIRLLALSNLEIEAFVAGEMEKNPLLETVRDEDDSFTPDGIDRPDDTPALSAEIGDASTLIAQGMGDTDAPLDVDHSAESFIDESPADRQLSQSPSNNSAGPAVSADAIDFDSFAQKSLGLHNHLIAQAGAALSGIDVMIATQIIGQIDDAGYLDADLTQLAQLMGTTFEHVERVLHVVQTFDPTGVGARSLSECLQLQAIEADRYDPCMAMLMANLDLLAKGAIPQLKRLCGVDDEDMADMIRELRAYDPKPGLRFGSELATTIIPDIFVRPIKNGWFIEVNSATLPRILVNQNYYAELSQGVADKNGQLWLADCLASANWLVKALDQRQKTIIKVATEIVRHQEAFFQHGVTHLKPLTLKAVAEAVGLHESTVSRVTSNKYLSCPRGLYELKYFFRSGVSNSTGDGALSAEAVKSHIKSLIAGEDPQAILSDDTLVDMLRNKGMDIARRTVAKYRESMNIGSSVQRRRQKAIVRNKSTHPVR